MLVQKQVQYREKEAGRDVSVNSCSAMVLLGSDRSSEIIHDNCGAMKTFQREERGEARAHAQSKSGNTQRSDVEQATGNFNSLLLMSEILQGSVLGSVIFNIFSMTWRSQDNALL